jgi:hypothetical protein
MEAELTYDGDTDELTGALRAPIPQMIPSEAPRWGEPKATITIQRDGTVTLAPTNRPAVTFATSCRATALSGQYADGDAGATNVEFQLPDPTA